MRSFLPDIFALLLLAQCFGNGGIFAIDLERAPHNTGLQTNAHEPHTFIIADTQGRYALRCSATPGHGPNSQFLPRSVFRAIELASLLLLHDPWQIIDFDGWTFVTPYGGAGWRDPKLMIQITPNANGIINHAVARILILSGMGFYMSTLTFWWGPTDCEILQIVELSRYSHYWMQRGFISLRKAAP